MIFVHKCPLYSGPVYHNIQAFEFKKENGVITAKLIISKVPNIQIDKLHFI